ncbi:MAG: sulfite exporter TauE/SafE family protein, partial [Gammaproteobacteria bacterium]
MSIYILYVLIGFFAGIISGLLGIGGGIIVVPGLAFIFLHQGIGPPNLVMHMAIGSSLAIMVATTFATVRAYHQFGWVLWPLYKRMILGIVIGSIFGVILADLIQSELLFIIFGLFLIAISCTMLFLRKPDANISLPRPMLLNLTTTAIGTQASLLGVGGG